MVLTSVLQRLRAAPAASDKTASIAARQRTVAVQQSAWILMGMPLPAASAAKHSCATTAEVKQAAKKNEANSSPENEIEPGANDAPQIMKSGGPRPLTQFHSLRLFCNASVYSRPVVLSHWQ